MALPTPPPTLKKDEGSLIAGFALSLVVMGVGTYLATRAVGDVLGPVPGKNKALAILAVALPLLFLGQRAMVASAAGRIGESRGLFFGIVSGALAGAFASFVIEMSHGNAL